MMSYNDLLKKATDSPLGKSALGVVVILLFGLQATSMIVMLNLYSKSEERNDRRMENLYKNMSKTADGLNALTQMVAVGFRGIEVTLHIPPADRGPMTSPTVTPPKPVTLTPPPSKEN